MALTQEEAALLAQLEQQRDAPAPRTTTGLQGILHTVLDVASGNVPHLAADAWEALHAAVEALGHGQAQVTEAAGTGTETEPAG